MPWEVGTATEQLDGGERMSKSIALRLPTATSRMFSKVLFARMFREIRPYVAIGSQLEYPHSHGHVVARELIALTRSRIDCPAAQ
ncbi:hypothetical protein ABIA39_000220 [Nocardia sp. GAS34]